MVGSITNGELFEFVNSTLEDIKDRPGKGKSGKAVEKGGKTDRPSCPGWKKGIACESPGEFLHDFAGL